MLSDDISSLSPIPLKDADSPIMAMCVGGVEMDDDLESNMRASSEFGSAKASSSSSDHSALLQAQQVLAEERFLEAEAMIAMRRAKVDAARIAVEIAAHKSSSQSSRRSRSRFVSQQVPVENKAGDAAEMQADAFGLSRDLSSLIHRVEREEEEPMVEPEDFAVTEEAARFINGAIHEINEVKRQAELHIKELMTHEHEQRILFEESSQARHNELIAHERQRLFAAEMQAQEREAQILHHA